MAPNFLGKHRKRFWISLSALIILIILCLYFSFLGKDAVISWLNGTFTPAASETIYQSVPWLVGLTIAILINIITSRSEEKSDDKKAEIKELPAEPAKPATAIPPEQKFYPFPFLPNLDYFEGRKRFLKRLQAQLDKTHKASIHDIPGMGKTFTTYKFAKDNEKNYDKIFFIRSTRKEMLGNLAKCGEVVNSDLLNVKGQHLKASGFKDWLEKTEERCLIIYDNVDAPSELSKYAPNRLNGDCIFTSNSFKVAILAPSVTIGKLPDIPAKTLLNSTAKKIQNKSPVFDRAQTYNTISEEEEAFNNLIKEIDGLPLTLNTTGAFIFNNKWSFATFWREYNRTPEIVWDSEDEANDYYPGKSACKVFSLAYNEVSRTKDVGEAVGILLNFVSFLSPDEIPEKLLREILQSYPKYHSKAKDDMFWYAVRLKLTDYDLLKYDNVNELFTTHRAFQKVIQINLRNNAKGSIAARLLAATYRLLKKDLPLKIEIKNNEAICKNLAKILSAYFPEYRKKNKEICEKYYQHVRIFLENIEKLQIKTEEIYDLFYKIGFYQQVTGNYLQSEASYSRASELSGYLYGEKSNEKAVSLNNLGVVYHLLSKYTKALGLFDQALYISQENKENESEESQLAYITRVNNKAAVLSDLGEYGEAIKLYETVIEYDEKVINPNEEIIGKKKSRYAVHLNNLAMAYQKNGEIDKALERINQALEIAKKKGITKHPHYAIGLTNKALICNSQKEHGEAILLLNRALEIGKNALGEVNFSYAKRLYYLGVVHYHKKKYKLSEEFYLQALTIFDKILINDHREKALCHSRLGLVHFKKKNYKEALPYFEEAHKQYLNLFGKDHRFTQKRKEELDSCRVKWEKTQSIS